MFNKNKKGFTLIELLVVITIIGILSSVVLASLNSVRQKSRDSRRIADIEKLKVALELYFNSTRNYPDTLGDLAPTYITAVSVDPLGTPYAYFKCSITQYHIGASLEDPTHAALSSDLDSAPNECIGSTIDSPDTDGCGNETNLYCYDVSN